ncbi:rRNA-processing protein las1 [Orbilia oligospora]|uniref:rRNA-processing protein las1 n=1 Tax=Orbilia oligospora TaxID=2813651 RepID=A0A6G1M9W7_ORBOL|nr:rRNA-processing protein las1 [Orbilia oligospora]KAF3222147.1 rRNA-processing protein las1 [Orbilia oligospora]KAF3249980.1 rRNA-processing protein las1 [Orbilia oligospora]
MLQPPRLTVWSSIDDLKHLKSLLYDQNADYDGRPQALEIIRAWLSRGRLPHAIESTSHLTECLLNDTPNQSELLIRMSYSTAICRFVNGLLDPAQKSHFAVSMYSLAQELGLPASFVDVRHAATHEALPPLGVLRTTCARGLDWLWANYWEKVEEVGGVVDAEAMGKEGEVVDQERVSRVQGLLERWEALKKSGQGRYREASKRKEERGEANICSELEVIFKKSAGMDILLEILVHEHLLVVDDTRSMMSIYKTTESWRPLIQELDLRVEEFTSGLFNTFLEAMQEVEDTKDENKDEFAESESEYTYQWLEFLIGLVLKGKLAADSASLLDDVVSRCILSRNLWCLRLAEYAIGQSTLLETKYSQACTTAKKQLTATPKPASNPISKHPTSNLLAALTIDKDSSMDLDQELEDFETKLRNMQAQREQWDLNKKIEATENAKANLDTSTAVMNGNKAARFRRVDADWTPRPMGVA